MILDTVDIRGGAVVPAPAVKYPDKCTLVVANLVFLEGEFLKTDFSVKSLFDANINIQSFGKLIHPMPPSCTLALEYLSRGVIFP